MNTINEYDERSSFTFIIKCFIFGFVMVYNFAKQKAVTASIVKPTAND